VIQSPDVITDLCLFRNAYADGSYATGFLVSSEVKRLTLIATLVPPKRHLFGLVAAALEVGGTVVELVL